MFPCRRFLIPLLKAAVWSVFGNGNLDANVKYILLSTIAKKFLLKHASCILKTLWFATMFCLILNAIYLICPVSYNVTPDWEFRGENVDYASPMRFECDIADVRKVMWEFSPEIGTVHSHRRVSREDERARVPRAEKEAAPRAAWMRPWLLFRILRNTRILSFPRLVRSWRRNARELQRRARRCPGCIPARVYFNINNWRERIFLGPAREWFLADVTAMLLSVIATPRPLGG